MHFMTLPYAYDRFLPRAWRYQRIGGNAVPCLRLFGPFYLVHITAARSLGEI
jgi:hypothetical protein